MRKDEGGCGWPVMVLAAGFGTRLRPLTDHCPKALVPVANRPLLAWVLERLVREGAGRAVVNAHYRAGQVAALVAGKVWDIPVDLRREAEILGTGGGILNARDALAGDCFVTVNADVVTNYPLAPAIDRLRESGVLAVLIMHDEPRFNGVLVRGDGIVTFSPGTDRAADPPGTRRLAYTGLQVCSSRLLDCLAAEKARGFSVIDVYEHLLRAGREQVGVWRVPSPGGYWRDLGTIADYRALHRDLAADPAVCRRLLGRELHFPLVSPDAVVADGVELAGATTVGRGAVVGAGSRLDDTILWDRASVGNGCRLERTVLASGASLAAGSRLRDAVLTAEMD